METSLHVSPKPKYKTTLYIYHIPSYAVPGPYDRSLCPIKGYYSQKLGNKISEDVHQLTNAGKVVYRDNINLFITYTHRKMYGAEKNTLNNPAQKARYPSVSHVSVLGLNLYFCVWLGYQYRPGSKEGDMRWIGSS